MIFLKRKYHYNNYLFLDESVNMGSIKLTSLYTCFTNT